MKNNEMTGIKKTVITALMVALAVVLPMAFHSIPNGGTIFSPMHLPVLLCGLLCGPFYGAAAGILGPVFSSLITGMPGPAYLPTMVIELFAYGLFTGLFMKLIRTGHIYGDLYISLVLSMLIGKVLAGSARALIFARGRYTFASWFTGYFVTALPGLILQLLLIPSIIFALEKAQLIPARYQKKDN